MNEAFTKLEDRFTETVLDDEVLVMSLADGNFFSLAGTARQIWCMIDGERTRDMMVAELGEKYEMAREVIEEGIDSFLEELREAGLVAGT